MQGTAGIGKVAVVIVHRPGITVIMRHSGGAVIMSVLVMDLRRDRVGKRLRARARRRRNARELRNQEQRD